MVSVLRIYYNNIGEDCKAFASDSNEVFKVINYYGDRFEILSCEDNVTVGWIEDIYGIKNLSELKDKKVRFCKGSIYILGENNEIKREFEGELLRHLK